MERFLVKLCMQTILIFYSISYRDFDSIIEVPLPEFLKISENFELIPSNRILEVKKGEIVLYRRFVNVSGEFRVYFRVYIK